MRANVRETTNLSLVYGHFVYVAAVLVTGLPGDCHCTVKWSRRTRGNVV